MDAIARTINKANKMGDGTFKGYFFSSTGKTRLDDGVDIVGDACEVYDSRVVVGAMTHPPHLPL